MNYTLYLSQLLISLPLSKIVWIHANVWILTAGKYQIFSPASYAPQARTPVSQAFPSDAMRGAVEC